jgi:hypothetical protein
MPPGVYLIAVNISHISYHIIRSYQIIYRITSHRIVYLILYYLILSYRILSYHNIMSYIMSCHVMSCRVVSCRVISYIISYKISYIICIIYHIISNIISIYWIVRVCMLHVLVDSTVTNTGRVLSFRLCTTALMCS